MERHNILRVSDQGAQPKARHRWHGCTERRFRPAGRPVAIDRPREEQTWPTPLEVRSQPPQIAPDNPHPSWPGRRRPCVPCYQRRLDRHTDGIVRSFRVHRERRAVTGRRRGLTTHRRPVALMDEKVQFGRGTEAHYEAVFAGNTPTYRRLRFGVDRPFGFPDLFVSALAGLRTVATPSPRRATIATVAVLVLVLSTVGAGLAQQRYVVQPGDSIESIATTFGVDPEGIRRSSYLPSGDVLQAGQVLVIPDPGQSPSEAAVMAAELEGTSPWVATAHWVEYGDTLASIAAAYGHNPGAIAEFNGIINPTSIVPGDRILIPPVRDGSDQVSAGSASAVMVPGAIAYQQQRNLSCEYAAVRIATAMLGSPIEEHIFINSVPKSNNPHDGYRGDIDGWWGNTDDYGVYPSALLPVIEDFGYTTEVMYTMGDPDALIAHIDAGHPVVVWLGFWGDTRDRLHDEGTYSVAAGMHVVTAYGYDDGGVYVSDPASATLDYYTWSEFTEMWKVLDGMSLAIS